MIKINLRQANLSKAELGHVNLYQACLHLAKLRKANLTKANLCQADFSSANLNQANLESANLRQINFSKAELVITNLRKTDLRRADLRRANLSKANLVEARLNGANLYGTDLSHASLIRTKLIKANLTNTTLVKANLTGANLTGANLTGANLTEANLHHVSIINCQLKDTVWDNANLNGTRFKNCQGLTQTIKRTMKNKGAIFISAKRQPYHFLVITDQQGTRSISLHENSYVLGRDAKAGIQIHDQSVSRHHATLRRLFDSDNKAFYNLIDGDLEGTRSKNGIEVNQLACRSEILESGDVIEMGKAKICYQIESLNMTELKQRLSSIPD